MDKQIRFCPLKDWRLYLSKWMLFKLQLYVKYFLIVTFHMNKLNDIFLSKIQQKYKNVFLSSSPRRINSYIPQITKTDFLITVFLMNQQENGHKFIKNLTKNRRSLTHTSTIFSTHRWINSLGKNIKNVFFSSFPRRINSYIPQIT